MRYLTGLFLFLAGAWMQATVFTPPQAVSIALTLIGIMLMIPIIAEDAK